jgi:ParB/RepB/Spo0J family partition protein
MASVINKNPTKEVLLLDPKTIIVNEAANYRFEQSSTQSVQELARSFQADGQIHPVTVRLKDGNYHLIAGYRRHRAALLLAKTDQKFRLKAILVDADDENALRLAVTENLERENLSPIDTALAQKRFKDDYGWSDKVLGAFFKMSPNTVSHLRQLLKLPASVQRQIHDGTLSIEAGQELARLPAKEAERLASTGTSDPSKSTRMGRSTIIKRKAQKLRGTDARPKISQVQALLEIMVESLDKDDPLVHMAKALLDYVRGKCSLRVTKEFLFDLAVNE